MGIAILFKILIVLLAYLIGSIPTAYILFKIKKGDDIRKYGSGNVGGTNIIRGVEKDRAGLNKPALSSIKL